MNPPKRDLFVVVADLDAEMVIKTLLGKRQPALGIQLAFDPTSGKDFLRYNKRDSGCCRDAEIILRTPMRSHRHALILLDRHGSGADDDPRETIEAAIEQRLCQCGWSPESVAAIVLEPELESWVWSDSPHVSNALGWGDDIVGLRSFLEKNNFCSHENIKPFDPKEALAKSLRQKKGGASLFAELAEKVGLNRCTDPAFVKFRKCLQAWFSV